MPAMEKLMSNALSAVEGASQETKEPTTTLLPPIMPTCVAATCRSAFKLATALACRQARKATLLEASKPMRPLVLPR